MPLTRHSYIPSAQNAAVSLPMHGSVVPRVQQPEPPPNELSAAKSRGKVRAGILTPGPPHKSLLKNCNILIQIPSPPPPPLLATSSRRCKICQLNSFFANTNPLLPAEALRSERPVIKTAMPQLAHVADREAEARRWRCAGGPAGRRLDAQGGRCF